MSVPVYIQQPTIGNRPMGRLDAQSRPIPGSWGDLAMRGIYSGTNLTYIGLARPGSSTSATVWQIRQLTYDGSNNLLSITWPQDSNGKASNDYEFIWNNYASYTYS